MAIKDSGVGVSVGANVGVIVGVSVMVGVKVIVGVSVGDGDREGVWVKVAVGGIGVLVGVEVGVGPSPGILHPVKINKPRENRRRGILSFCIIRSFKIVRRVR
jgi:hypothetical protein